MESQEVNIDISEDLFGQKMIKNMELEKKRASEDQRAKISIDTQMIDWSKAWVVLFEFRIIEKR